MRVSRRFERNDRMVAASRRFVTGALPEMQSQTRDAIELMVSELSSNALTHAGSGFEVIVETSDTSVRVEVRDDGPGLPVMRFPDSNEPHGRGLQVVGLLSDEWGSTTEADGKRVWFRINFRAREDSSEQTFEESPHIESSDPPRIATSDVRTEAGSVRKSDPQLLLV